ncbi:hypothetical protein CM15mP35_01440 [bacterium]|nr:MAG: hypothetical protein CM15mP35_01440 [bacterium]
MFFVCFENGLETSIKTNATFARVHALAVFFVNSLCPGLSIIT